MANARRQTQNWFQSDDNRNVPSQQRQGQDLSFYPASYFGPLSSFFSDMDRVFDQTLRRFGMPTLSSIPGMWGMQQAFRPNVAIRSMDDHYLINVEVPGISEKDIHVELSDHRTLTISGEKKIENEEHAKDIQCNECSYGAFTRTLTLPEDVDQEAVEARFKNGVLTIMLPRRESSKSHSRRIPIGSSRQADESPRQGAQLATGQNPKKAA